MSLQRAARSSCGTMSSLLSTSQRGLAASSGSYFSSSLASALASLTGSTRVAQRRRVDHVQQQAGALQVAQELVAQAGALGGALDQARDVGHDEALLGRDAHDAEIRMQRGERVVGDLRAAHWRSP